MLYTEILVVGGGPAGMGAALKAAEQGCKVMLLERYHRLGGQLLKQSHRFFGSREEYAGIRGINIAREMADRLSHMKGVTLYLEATAQGYYEDGVLAFTQQGSWQKVKAKKIIVATGAAERFLPFINNDLPGVYGAGAVQTLMNLYGIIPGKRVLMVGAGNIGLIVSYQLLQAGVKVVAVVEAAPKIGGYLVHAAKIRRAGVPIYTRMSIQKALGEKMVERAEIYQLDENGQAVPGTVKTIAVDTICLAVGLRPLIDLLVQAGCQLAYVPELGGDVPVRDENLRTSNEKFYVAGDASGIEEATAAILEGRLAGLAASRELGHGSAGLEEEVKQIKKELKSLRSGPTAKKIRKGLLQVRGDENAGKDRYSH